MSSSGRQGSDRLDTVAPCMNVFAGSVISCVNFSCKRTTTGMAVKEIKTFADFHKIIDSGRPVIVDFWAEWCAPCKAMLPVFEELSTADSSEGIDFYKVNIDSLDDVAQEVGIRTIPAFMLFKDGNKLREHVGAHRTMLEALVAEGKRLL